MTDWIYSSIDQFGYLAVIFLIAIENIFPPIPSEVILCFGGFMTSSTKMNIGGLIIASTIGALIGALALYGFGRILNEERLEKIFSHKLFKRLGFKANDVNRSIAWFDCHGIKAIFFGRFIPVIRSLISIPAGIAKVKMLKFLILTTLGSLIWNTVLIILGAYMGSKWEVIVTIFAEYSLIVSVILLIAICYCVYRWYKSRIKE